MMSTSNLIKYLSLKKNQELFNNTLISFFRERYYWRVESFQFLLKEYENDNIELLIIGGESNIFGEIDYRQKNYYINIRSNSSYVFYIRDPINNNDVQEFRKIFYTNNLERKFKINYALNEFKLNMICKN